MKIILLALLLSLGIGLAAQDVKVVCSTGSFFGLEDELNNKLVKLIKSGYKAQGGVSVSVCNLDLGGGFRYIICQTMVKEK
jgi:hypothetical protein